MKTRTIDLQTVISKKTKQQPIQNNCTTSREDSGVRKLSAESSDQSNTIQSNCFLESFGLKSYDNDPHSKRGFQSYLMERTQQGWGYNNLILTLTI